LLKAKKTEGLSAQLEHVMKELRDNTMAITIEDPANPTGNDLSELWNDAVRSEVAAVAKTTLATVARSGWEAVFSSVATRTEDGSDVRGKADELRRAASRVTAPTKPWRNRE
jgi:hypothetical protein